MHLLKFLVQHETLFVHVSSNKGTNSSRFIPYEKVTFSTHFKCNFNSNSKLNSNGPKNTLEFNLELLEINYKCVCDRSHLKKCVCERSHSEIKKINVILL